MATTFATIWKRNNAMAAVGGGITEVDPYALRSLPGDDVFFFVKRVDNSRMVRQADPHASQECWSTVGAGALLLMIGVSIVVPHVALVKTGYALEALKTERQTLLDKRQALDVKEAALLSPTRLNEMAKAQNLTSPMSGQVVHLDGANSQGNLASNHLPAELGR